MIDKCFSCAVSKSSNEFITLYDVKLSMKKCGSDNSLWSGVAKHTKYHLDRSRNGKISPLQQQQQPRIYSETCTLVNFVGEFIDWNSLRLSVGPKCDLTVSPLIQRRVYVFSNETALSVIFISHLRLLHRIKQGG